MPSVRVATTLHHPCEEVCDAFAGGRRFGAWHPGAKGGIRQATPGPLGRGTRFRAAFKGTGEHEYELVEFDRPCRLVMLAPSPLGPLRHEVVCEPVAGGARLTEVGRVEVRDPRWPAAWLTRPWFAKLFRDAQAALARYLDAGAAAAPRDGS